MFPGKVAPSSEGTQEGYTVLGGCSPHSQPEGAVSYTDHGVPATPLSLFIVY